MELHDVWRAALAEIELQVSKPNFVTWFKNSKLVDKRDGVALIALPNVFTKKWVEDKYGKTILSILRTLDDDTKKLEFVVQGQIKETSPLKHPSQKPSPFEDVGQLSFIELKIDPETNLNPRYTFQTFIVGKSNELAYAAATSVIQEIGRKYNPLFFYGGVGVGKTHLIQGIGNEIKKLYANKIRVKYVSSERFTNEVISAIRNRRMETIKEKYRLIDVLIIDDIQFIAGKAATEEEFFHTFNALHEQNKQIVISSDRPPKFIPTLEERLRSRFEGGMIVDIGYPDYELRCAIIKTKLQNLNITLPEELIGFIAQKIQKGIRELEGILNRIVFMKSKRGVEITPKTIEAFIQETIQEPVRNVNPNQILKAVADFAEIPLNDLTNKSRKKELVEHRQIAMYLMRDMLGLSYPFIGRKLGNRDHTTAIYACEKVVDELSKNPALQQKILLIKEMITKE